MSGLNAIEMSGRGAIERPSLAQSRRSHASRFPRRRPLWYHWSRVGEGGGLSLPRDEVRDSSCRVGARQAGRGRRRCPAPVSAGGSRWRPAVCGAAPPERGLPTGRPPPRRRSNARISLRWVRGRGSASSEKKWHTPPARPRKAAGTPHLLALPSPPAQRKVAFHPNLVSAAPNPSHGAIFLLLETDSEVARPDPQNRVGIPDVAQPSP